MILDYFLFNYEVDSYAKRIHTNLIVLVLTRDAIFFKEINLFIRILYWSLQNKLHFYLCDVIPNRKHPYTHVYNI